MTAPMAVKHGAVILLVLVLILVNGRPNSWRQRQVLMEERATLLAFKRGLIGPTSAIADWNESNDDVCGFTGVTCDWRRRHVIGLGLESMNISGPIQPVVGNLSHLRSLNMSNNRLTGLIPGELSNLRRLMVLTLAQNQLSGSIPESLAALPLLWFFDLNQNNLSGPIPASLFLNCTQLVIVDFGDNNLSSEIPQDASANLTDRFEFLNLYSNQLTGRIPRWLANCTCLSNLDVEDNLLHDELPTEIIRDKQNLLYLHLSNNRFRSHDDNTNLEPFFAAMRNCSNISEIEAGAVGIGGRLPSHLGSMLPPIISHLKLELNEIEGPIPADIGDVINITLMNLSYNLLNGTIPESICRLQRLQQLDLSDNFLTGAIPPCIGNAKMLGELDLSRNALSGGIPGSIGNLRYLSIVSLRRNPPEIPASLY